MKIAEIDNGMVTIALHPSDCFDIVRVLDLAQESCTDQLDYTYRQLDALQSLFELAGLLAKIQAHDARGQVPSFTDLLKNHRSDPER